MGKYFDFQDEEKEWCRVRFEVLKSESQPRPYGIGGEIWRGESCVERAEATNRFLTREEAEQTMEMLCRFQVTPCTLCDII